MTDLLGVRVITPYYGEVSRVVEVLRAQYDVDELNSIDKTSELKPNEFGYRSVHVVLKMGRIGILSAAAQKLEIAKVEVQVRSVIEHAWAEAEHELRYKSGVVPSPLYSRRFNALAGALEIIDRELDSLSRELPELVRAYELRYRAGDVTGAPLDSARLMALFLVNRPGAATAEPNGLPADFRTAAACVRALKSIGISDDRSLSTALEASTFRAVARSYADRRGGLPESLSMAAVTAGVVGVVSVETLSDHPLLNDPVMRLVVADLA